MTCSLGRAEAAASQRGGPARWRVVMGAPGAADSRYWQWWAGVVTRKHWGVTRMNGAPEGWMGPSADTHTHTDTHKRMRNQRCDERQGRWTVGRLAGRGSEGERGGQRRALRQRAESDQRHPHTHPAPANPAPSSWWAGSKACPRGGGQGGCVRAWAAGAPSSSPTVAARPASGGAGAASLALSGALLVVSTRGLRGGRLTAGAGWGGREVGRGATRGRAAPSWRAGPALAMTGRASPRQRPRP